MFLNIKVRGVSAFTMPFVETIPFLKKKAMMFIVRKCQMNRLNKNDPDQWPNNRIGCKFPSLLRATNALKLAAAS